MYHSLIHMFMVKGFKDSRTEDAFNGLLRKGIPADLIKAARRKLRLLHAAHMLMDLRVPPGNRLEAERGNTRSVSTISSGFALFGLQMGRRTLS
jgi:toxin HigB-1